MKRSLFPILVLLLFALATPEALAQRGTANTAREQARITAESQARAEIESLLARLCPGRCELVEVRATVSEPQAQGEVIPGFEGASGTRFEAEVRRLQATILMDSTLPDNFRTNIPRMVQFRLQHIAPTIDVRPEFLEFPQPQLPPMPEVLPPVPQQPPPRPEPLPEPQPALQDASPAPEQPSTTEPTADDAPLWQEVLPWIALLLTLLILGGLIIMILRRLEALSTHRPDSDERQGDHSDGDPRINMPDVDALLTELKSSRPVLNHMLRKWLDDDPAELAILVRLIGPEILSDLRRDTTLRPDLEILSDEVARLHETLAPAEAHAIAEKARSRHAAQLVVDDSAGDGDWDFLEGLSLAQVHTLTESASQRERGFVLSRLSPVIRSRYLETLDAEARRRLLLEAGSAEALTRTQARQLAARLRQIADEFIDAGRQAHGQAALLVEMIDAMSLHEQQDVLRDLQEKRPDVADALLSSICLESAILQLPQTALANAVHSLPIETMTAFLQGTGRDIVDHILSAAPGSRRQALTTELSLDIPTARADFLDARKQFTTAILTALRRDGFEVAKFNANALRRGIHSRTSPSEVAE